MNVEALRKDLKLHCQGGYSLDVDQLRTYSQDESIFELMPKVVVFPKDEKDLGALIDIASFHRLHMTPRGGGTGVAGQSIGNGMIVDFSRWMNALIEVDGNHAWVQPGIVLSQLNRMLEPQGLWFAPDPGSKDRCTLGGMVSTNASGPHKAHYGDTRKNILDLYWHSMQGHGWLLDAKNVLKDLQKQLQPFRQFIQSSKPNVKKNSSGYFLENIFSSSANLVEVAVGSEGTLGFCSAIRCLLHPIPPQRTFAIYSFSQLSLALEFVSELLQTDPSAVELVDPWITLALTSDDPALMRELGLEQSQASLWVEWECNPSFQPSMKPSFVTSDKLLMKRIWGLRSRASTIIHAQAKDRQPLRCIEDACVPVDRMVGYVDRVQKLLKKHDCEGPIFGHVGDGHLHINPQIDVGKENLRARVQSLMEEFYLMVLECGGTISGEHGDGILRSAYTQKQWSHQWLAFEVVKQFFDPKCLFNPGKIIPVEKSFFPLKSVFDPHP
ncbi:MAG: FAD-binding oxidoreductase [Bdellovibrionota bacterium]